MSFKKSSIVCERMRFPAFMIFCVCVCAQKTTKRLVVKKNYRLYDSKGMFQAGIGTVRKKYIKQGN